MAHVLIGFAEALPAAEVLFSLRKHGFRVSVFSRGTGHPLKHLGPEKVHVLPDPEHDSGAAISALKTIMSMPDAPDFVLPLDDDGLWLSNAALGTDPRNVGATGSQARVALDKQLQISAARDAGFSVPPTIQVVRPSDLDQCSTFPAIAKPALAVSEDGNRLGKGKVTYLLNTTDKDRLQQALQEDMNPLLVQPLIAGVGEGVFGYASAQGVVAWSGHQRLRMMNPHGSGSSACMSLVPDEETRRHAQAFLTAIGWRGPFMLELLRDEQGTKWFMELNGRMWGSLALARRQGFEYPAWAVQGALDPAFIPPTPDVSQTPVIQRDLGRELLHLLFVLRGPKSDFHREGWPRFWQSAWGVFTPAHPRRFYDYDPSHKFYFIRKALWTFRKAVWR